MVVLDLDTRQQSTAHFFANRAAWMRAAGATLPLPENVAAEPSPTWRRWKRRWESPPISRSSTLRRRHRAFRAAHQRADVIVTPMNDSFVDFGMLGVVDPVSLELVRPSLYAEAVWEARKAMERGRSIDWIVLRNRLAPVEARNRRRVDERLAALSRRVGFRGSPVCATG